MAGRLFTLRLLRSAALHPSPQAHSSSSAPSLSILNSLLDSRFFSSRRPASKDKSLIEDEAELSDWISDIKTDSVRFKLSSDSDDDSARRNTRNSRGSAQKRRIYSDSDDEEDNDRFASRSGRGGRISGGRDKGFSGGERGGRGGRGKAFSGGDRGGRGGRGNGFSGGRDMGRRESNFDLSDDERGFRGQGRGRMSGPQRGGRGGRGNQSFSCGRDRNTNDSNSDFNGRGGTAMPARERTKQIDSSSSEEEETEEDESESDNDNDNGFSVPEPGFGSEETNVKSSDNGGNLSYLSQKRFDECSLSQLTLKGLNSAGYEQMTVVQEATLPVILQGKDVLAKARTGTGKTVAFLLPAIEMVAGLPPVDRDDRKPPFNVLVICPTRELADQAAQEASKLVKHHASISAQLVIGGTRLALEQKRMQTNPSQILVGTPGRLKDHMENTPGFAARLKGIKVLVLDEADRLLDMGFRTDIEKIIEFIPKQRQSLLFSATVPDQVKQMCHIALKRDFEFINTVEEGSEETHTHVKQMHIIAPLENQFGILYGLLNDHISETVDYKVIVFCTMAMMTRLVAEYLSELKLNVREIHSRKPQSYRTRVSKEFKESKGLILVSSDVSARGVDYPDVTLVIQIGAPADREQYIHRLGRTGRKGKEGSGVLILSPWENFFLRNIKDLPISEAPLPLIDPQTTKKVERALAHVEEKDKEKAYQAWLGYYNSNKNVGKDKYKLVELANEFSRSIGMDNPPSLPKLILRKMGLNNIPGLRSK